MSHNKKGLSRDIPAAIRRTIRQQSHFACVKCGYIRGDYAHIDPSFNEASEHDSDRICLLCSNCHKSFDSGYYDASYILECYEACKNGHPPAKHGLDFLLRGPSIRICFGENEFESPRSIIDVDGVSHFSVQVQDGIPLINANFQDELGSYLMIEDNIIVSGQDLYDIVFKGANVSVWREKRNQVVSLTLQQPDWITIDRLKFRLGDMAIQVENGFLMVESNVSGLINQLELHGFSSRASDKVISVDSRQYNLDAPAFSVKMVGGEGLEIVGSGIRICQGGVFWVKSFVLNRKTQIRP